MDRLTSMAMFVRVVEKRSLAAAAREAGISATMIGNHVRGLEERLGGRLLHRTTRQQSLTELGRIYYERCRQILADVEATESCVTGMRGGPRGLLRINAPVSFGSHRLTPALVEYLHLYPEVTIDLNLNDRVVDLVEEGYEVVFRIGVLADSNLIARRLAPYQMAICAAPAYLKRHGTPLIPADLAKHNCLGFTCSSLRNEWRLDTLPGTGVVRVAGRLQVNNGQALRIAALSGFGIIMQPEALLADDLADGRLVRLLPEHEPPAAPMHLIYMPDRRLTPKLRSIIDFTIERFG